MRSEAFGLTVRRQVLANEGRVSHGRSRRLTRLEGPTASVSGQSSDILGAGGGGTSSARARRFQRLSRYRQKLTTGSEAEFLRLIQRNPAVNEILARLPELDVPDAWLASGCLFQTVWNVLAGESPTRAIKDYDVFYFPYRTLRAIRGR